MCRNTLLTVGEHRLGTLLPMLANATLPTVAFAPKFWLIDRAGDAEIFAVKPVSSHPPALQNSHDALLRINSVCPVSKMTSNCEELSGSLPTVKFTSQSWLANLTGISIDADATGAAKMKINPPHIVE